MSEPRFDVFCGPNSGQFVVDHHFCREDGCYGGHEEHGLSWEEAREKVADHLRDLADRWEETSLDEWRARGGPK